jgi:hypothetical protein
MTLIHADAVHGFDTSARTGDGMRPHETAPACPDPLSLRYRRPAPTSAYRRSTP